MVGHCFYSSIGIALKSVYHHPGVYLARDSTTSSSYYSTVSRSSWHKSALAPSNCMALVEVINQPAKFVSSNPHYVVKDTHWIMW